ncbi:unnamed protein product [Gadus morhua 'NCC']
MVKPQSQHSGGRGVEQAGCSYAGDGEASWTAPAPGVISSLAGQQQQQQRSKGNSVHQLYDLTLSCDVCRASLVTDAVAVPFDQSYHLLELRNNGGLMIPSKGTVKVVRAAERAIRQHSPGKAPDEVVVAHFVREEIGTEDVFALGSHVQESQFGIDNHLSLLLSLVVSVVSEYGCIISPN